MNHGPDDAENVAEPLYLPIKREREFYGAALSAAQEGSASTGYGMPYNQVMRFLEFQKQILSGHVDIPTKYTLLDIGCGTGDLLPFLADNGREPGLYLGVDLMPEMVQAATQRADKEGWPTDWAFIQGDLRDDNMVAELDTYDVVTSIAAYALKEDHDSQQENMRMVQEAIEKMVSKARHAAFVTLFSTWKTNIIPEEMVLDPVTILAWAKSKWERVDLIHSYAPFDFSLVVYPGKSPWREAWEEQQDALNLAMAQEDNRDMKLRSSLIGEEQTRKAG